MDEPKLNLDDQINHIKKKSAFIKMKLNPVVSKGSLEYRKNLWQLFIQPLFEFTLSLHLSEPTLGRKEKIKRLLKHTFKSFTKISRTTSDEMIYQICGYNIDERAANNEKLQETKWKERFSTKFGIDKEVVASEKTPSELAFETKGQVNMCKGIPAIGVELINLLTKICPFSTGKKNMNREHLAELHKIGIPNPVELFGKIQMETNNLEFKKPMGTRVARLQFAHQRIKPFVERIHLFLNNQIGNR